MKTHKIVFWISTVIVAAMMIMSGIMYLVNPQQIMEAMKTLGLPNYMRLLLGLAKIAGAVALVVPGFNTIKEWAYAGFTFVFVGATWTHISTGTPFVGPIIFLIILGVSYWAHHKLIVHKATA